MIKYVLALALLSVNHVFAEPKRMIECKDSESDWSVTISPDFTMANFFDNDHDVALNRTKMNFYETYPAQTEYEFSGKDRTNGIRFTYNVQKKSPSLTVNFGTADAFKVDLECAPVANDLDWKAVKKALANASKNGGSTRY